MIGKRIGENNRKIIDFLTTIDPIISVNKFATEKMADFVFSEISEGFCTWFILQYLKGYKPFVTIMEKEEIINFKIDKKDN